MKQLTLILICCTLYTQGQTLTLVKDVFPGDQNSQPGLLTVVNDQLFFIANDGTNGIEYWKTDGTTANTIMIKNIGVDDDSYCQSVWGCGSEFIVMNNIIYFRATDAAHGAELWRSDGTDAGTYMVKDINPGAGDCSNAVFMSGQYFAALNDVLYFAADGGGNNIELWRSDGTESGTYLVKDIRAGGSSVPQFITAIDDHIYFQCKNEDDESELWKSDGTEAGTILLKQMWVRAYEYKNMFVKYDDFIYFAGAETDPYDMELWRTDGTSAGTTLFMNINEDEGDGSDPKQLHVLNGKLIFVAIPDSGERLFISDGTEAGTTILEDENGDDFEPYFTGFLQTDSKLYFQGTDNDSKYGLWITDGTNAGTTFLWQFESGQFEDYAAARVSGNNIVFKGYDDDEGCTTLFQSNGTASGTAQVTSCDEISYPTGLTEYNGSIYMNGENDTYGAELWKFDATFTVGVETINSSQNINIFPNPAHDFIVVEMDNYLPNTVIAISNILGETVLFTILENNHKQISIAQLAPGLYFLHSENNAQQFIIE